MTKENLQKQTVPQLLEIAKERNIKGRHDMRKSVLIEKILETESKIENDNKSKYLETIVPGVLVAFKLPDGSVKSAKVVKRSTKEKKLKVITEYKAEYIISYDDVIWVKTGKRWPKGVYSLLKGNNYEQKAVG